MKPEIEAVLNLANSVSSEELPCISRDLATVQAVAQQQMLAPAQVQRGRNNLLQSGATDIRVLPATPVKRRGKSMSRRTGQDGYIEKSGRWYVVRWWQDVEGQQKRQHRRATICPIAGPGSLSKSARKRRAREIIAESGADSIEFFNRVVVPQQTGMTFREQAEVFLQSLRVRKRKPVAPSTIEEFDRVLNNWLNPHVGDLPLSEVGNGAMKKLVATMFQAGLAPKTIEHYTTVAKMVVGSAKDREGNRIYPREWNNDFIDMPTAEKQNTPSFSAEIMSGLARWKKPKQRMLFILCGGGGFRIGEALGIEIDKHISPDFLTIHIRQKVRHCKVERRVKTAAAERDVDLHPAIADLLKQFVGERKSGFLFASRNGKPLASSTILTHHLHRALKQLGYVNPHTGTHKAGSHAFRRFRNTYLRNHANCPNGLCKFWMGHHLGKDMSERYDKIREDVPFRREWAEKCGFGFELPSMVPNVPTNDAEAEAVEAA